MHLKEFSVEGFKSFNKNTKFSFPTNITGIVGPNGSGKSNIVEAFRFVLGEQSMKSMRGKRGEDLIFNGAEKSRKSNKATVSITFDNSDNMFDSEFGEISVSRSVYTDGMNEYSINGTVVRHRDIIELLAKANVGATGHHIISQGEADRILNNSPEERKEMIEDGLGLKLLQYKRIESEKKLKKAQTNISETDLLLKEILPHIKYLKSQIKKYEKTREIREDLKTLYSDYIVREINYIKKTKESVELEISNLKGLINKLEDKISDSEEDSEGSFSEDIRSQINQIEEKLKELRKNKYEKNKELGSMEGEMNAIQDAKSSISEAIDRSYLVDLYEEIKRKKSDESVSKNSFIDFILSSLDKILKIEISEKKDLREVELEKSIKDIKVDIQKLSESEDMHTKELENIGKTQEDRISDIKESRNVLIDLITEKNKLEKDLLESKHILNSVHSDEESLKVEMHEGSILIGNSINDYKENSLPNDADGEERTVQKDRKRTLERKKIELETLGTNRDESVMKEYESSMERVEFLEKEKNDLLLSIEDCEKCIDHIKKEIDLRFNEGVKKINKEFENLFRILFNGGRASISVETKPAMNEEDPPKVGVIIKTSLPHKKISSLEQLSGGERSLISIALLFAISQVTPPPFLILDETDAALDEANSKRYGDMLRSLAEKSQLILITHNRETMSNAGTLYGVTMSNDGISKLLSIQFEDAIKVAK